MAWTKVLPPNFCFCRTFFTRRPMYRQVSLAKKLHVYARFYITEKRVNCCYGRCTHVHCCSSAHLTNWLFSVSDVLRCAGHCSLNTGGVLTVPLRSLSLFMSNTSTVLFSIHGQRLMLYLEKNWLFGHVDCGKRSRIDSLLKL